MPVEIKEEPPWHSERILADAVRELAAELKELQSKVDRIESVVKDLESKKTGRPENPGRSQ